jgi:protein disulfide-isomerase-like protein
MFRFVLFATLCSVALATDEWSPGDKIVHLTDSDFDEFKGNNPSFLAMFYAPWCGHCKAMKPDYGIASIQAQFKMPLVAVDCTSEKTVCGEYKVQGFPTLKYFADGKATDYEGGRTDGAIMNFVDSKAPEENLDDLDFKKLRVKQLKKIIAERGQACTGCTEKHEFVAKAEEVRHMPKGGKKKKDGSKKKSSLVNGMTFAQERRHKEAVKIAEEGFGEVNGVVLHTVDFEWPQFRKDHPQVLVMFYAPWCGHCKTMKPHFGEASTTLEEQGTSATLAAMDCVSNPETCAKYGVKGYPTVLWFDTPESKGAACSARDTTGFVKFVTKKMRASGGELAPFQNVNQWEDDHESVVHLTDDYFNSYKEAQSPMLVFFYAPWCGHCKAAKPAFSEAAEALQGKLTMAAVDCTEEVDTCSTYGVTGYPTIKFFADASGKPEDYSGGRSASDFISFGETKSTGDAAGKDEL